MGRFVTGVAVVTTWSGAEPIGSTVNSLTSVSLDPCLLLICLKRDSITGHAIQAHGGFAINLLAADQQHLALRFAKPVDDRFEGSVFSVDERRGPLIPGCVAHIACDLFSVQTAGDHDIFLGHVILAAHDMTIDPLAFLAGKFGTYLQHPAVGVPNRR